MRASMQDPSQLNYQKEGVTKIKVPLLRYIYYSFLETDKISEDFQKELKLVADYIHKEVDRFRNLSEHPQDYLNFFINELLFMVNAFLKLYTPIL
jgi:hypothetical protein